MESPTLSPLSTIKIVRRTTNFSPSFPQKWLHPKQKLLNLKKKSPFLTHCTAKPHTNRENSREESLSPVEPSSNSSSGIEAESKPIPNQPISSSISSISRGLVLDLGSGDSWDNVEIGSPVVKRFLGDDLERWYMWYHGRSSKNPESDYVGLAVSSNGIHWERGFGGVKSGGDVGIVMNCSENWWGFDTHSVRPSEVVIMSSAKIRANSAVYWLYYTGFSNEDVGFSNNSSMDFGLENPERAFLNGKGEASRVFKSLPGLAMSQDGRHWARIEGEHHSGALFDAGQQGEWDSLFISSPQVVFHGNGDLRMYYHSFDAENGCFAIGMARSRDGMKWVKLGKIIGGGGVGAFDELGATHPHVVRNKKDGKYVMTYEGVGMEGKRSIGIAISSDGLKGWRRANSSPALRKSDGDGWDCDGVGSPCLVQMDGNGNGNGNDEDCEWRLYYRGVGRGGRTGIGMAVSNGYDFQSFQRWTGFHL